MGRGWNGRWALPLYNLLFRWLVGLAIDNPLWDVTVLTKLVLGPA